MKDVKMNQFDTWSCCWALACNEIFFDYCWSRTIKDMKINRQDFMDPLSNFGTQRDLLLTNIEVSQTVWVDKIQTLNQSKTGLEGHITSGKL